MTGGRSEGLKAEGEGPGADDAEASTTGGTEEALDESFSAAAMGGFSFGLVVGSKGNRVNQPRLLTGTTVGGETLATSSNESGGRGLGGAKEGAAGASDCMPICAGSWAGRWE